MGGSKGGRTPCERVELGGSGGGGRQEKIARRNEEMGQE